jgi:nickel/cobalt exporter
MTELFTAPGTWLYLPVAFALGALHALEPGHAKGLMAGFIVANRGSAAQAALLGASAAVSHSLVVWVIVAIGLALGEALPLERFHPWLELAGSVAMAGMLAFMLRGWLASRRVGQRGRDHVHPHAHPHEDHRHGREHGHDHGHSHPHPHPPAGESDGRGLGAGAIAWYGLTAGLNPCPAAVVVLLLCLKTGSVGLGLTTVAAFSLGLASVLVAVGVVASWGSTWMLARRPGDAGFAARLHLASLLLVAAMTLYAFAHVATHFT